MPARSHHRQHSTRNLPAMAYPHTSSLAAAAFFTCFAAHLCHTGSAQEMADAASSTRATKVSLPNDPVQNYPDYLGKGKKDQSKVSKKQTQEDHEDLADLEGKLAEETPASQPHLNLNPTPMQFVWR